MKTIEVEAYICVDSNGDYAVGIDSLSAIEKYEEDVGEIGATYGYRIVKAIIAVPLPTEIVLRGVASVEAEATLQVV